MEVKRICQWCGKPFIIIAVINAQAEVTNIG